MVDLKRAHEHTRGLTRRANPKVVVPQHTHPTNESGANTYTHDTHTQREIKHTQTHTHTHTHTQTHTQTHTHTCTHKQTHTRIDARMHAHREIAIDHRLGRSRTHLQ